MNNNGCHQPTEDNTTTPPKGELPNFKHTPPAPPAFPADEWIDERSSIRQPVEHYFKPEKKENYLKSIAKMDMAAVIRMKVDELNQLVRKAGKMGLIVTLTGNGRGELNSNCGQISISVNIKQNIEY